MQPDDNLYLEYFGLSDIGLVRKENQDSFGKFPADSDDRNQPKGLLFIVADGMGGHIGGKEASNSAVDIVSREYFSFSSDIISNCLKYAIKTANFQIHQSSREEMHSHRKGTTCSALVIEKNIAHVGHVGDSRIYRINQEYVEQITSDHTQVEEMLRKGILSREEAENHPSKSILVRALGIESEVEIDVIENIKIMPGDNFILCSDGLAKVYPEEIKGIVLAYSPEKACRELIKLANERGGYDNVTVQIVSFTTNDKTESIPVKVSNETPSAKSNKIFIVIIIVLALIALAFIFQDSIVSLFTKNPESKIEIQDNLNSEKELDPADEMMSAAEQYMIEGKLDTAVTLFKSVLKDNPMHVGALNGIDLIASEYLRLGHLQRKQNNYNEAIVLYQKAASLNPADKSIAGLIAHTKQELYKQESDEINNVDINANLNQEEQNLNAITESEKSDNVIFASFTPSNWFFNGLDENDYSINQTGLTFHNSSKSKIGLYDQEITDVNVIVNVTLPVNSQAGRAGIIIGYNDENGNEVPDYYLFSVDIQGNIKLLKRLDQTEENLVSVYRKISPIQNHYNFRLKLKSLGPWIMIYNDDKLLESWLGKEFVKGKLGLFADSGVHAEFTEFKVTTAFEKKDKK